MRIFNFKEKYYRDIAPRRTREGIFFEAITIAILLMSLIMAVAVWKNSGTLINLKALGIGIFASLYLLYEAYHPRDTEYGARAQTRKQRYYASRGIRIIALILALIIFFMELNNIDAIGDKIADIAAIILTGLLFTIWTAMVFLIKKIK